MVKKKIRILYIHHGGIHGGAPRSLAFLIDKLNKEIYDPIVLCFYDYVESCRLFKSVGAQVVFCEGAGPWHGSTVSGMSLNTLAHNLKRSVFLLAKLKKIVKDINPDIVHLNSTCLFLAARMVKKYKDIPVVCHVREPLLEGFWGNILRLGNEKFVDKYIAIEKYDADSLRTAVPVEIIHNFVDFSTYNLNVKSDILFDELGIDKESIIILYLARISSENGALEMLRGIKGFLQDESSIHLCLVGLKEMTRYSRAVVEEASSMKGQVHILPFRTDVTNIIASSDALIVPFTQPHFARSIIEAAAMGVPAIGADIGGVNELIINHSTGVLYDPVFPKSLHDSCQEVITDILNGNTMGRNAEKYARKNFDADINAGRTFQIYEELLEAYGNQRNSMNG